MPKSTSEPDWKLIERITALLEKSLSPSATVRHNVMLPVIGKPNRSPRQCDIVIEYGEPPRHIITIVEVQKRNRKPTITTFHGWIAKMREVGAQSLICVSALGFPKSIIDDVKTTHGPTVRLLKLEQLQEPTILDLSFVVPYMLCIKPHITLSQ